MGLISSDVLTFIGHKQTDKQSIYIDISIIIYKSIWCSGSSYEECRAECAGLHLCLVPGVSEIFGFSGAEADDINYVNWLSMVHAGIKGLEMFSPASMEWKQAHSQARYV